MALIQSIQLEYTERKSVTGKSRGRRECSNYLQNPLWGKYTTVDSITCPNRRVGMQKNIFMTISTQKKGFNNDKEQRLIQ